MRVRAGVVAAVVCDAPTWVTDVTSATSCTTGAFAGAGATVKLASAAVAVPNLPFASTTTKETGLVSPLQSGTLPSVLKIVGGGCVSVSIAPGPSVTDPLPS